VKCSNTAPQQRVFGQCAIVGRKMWVVGGCDPCSDAPLGDCWTLDIDAWTWEKVALKGVDIANVSQFQMVAIGTKLWLHSQHCGHDILMLNTETHTVVKHPVTGSAPSSRELHSMVCFHDCFYVFGGQGTEKGEKVFADVYCFNSLTLVWNEVTVSGKPPVSRCAGTGATIGTSLWFHGGSSKPCSAAQARRPSLLGDVVRLDLESMAWVRPELELGPQPQPRSGHAMCAVGNKLVVCGGSNASQKACDDTWTLDPVLFDDKTWQEDDYVLAVWFLGAIACLLLLLPGVPEGYWMIPAPFVPLVIWKGVPRLLRKTDDKEDPEDENSESKKTN